MNLRSLIYEPLYEFDALNPAQSHPWLATSYTFSTEAILTFTIRPNVNWSDGKAFTAQDVAATFKTIKDKQSRTKAASRRRRLIRRSGNSVTLHFNTAQYTNLSRSPVRRTSCRSICGRRSPIRPRRSPTRSAPAPTRSKSSTRRCRCEPQVLGRHPVPPISEVDVPYNATNDAASSALVEGNLDWAGNDIANIQQNFVSLNPQTNHYWFASGNTVTLWFNVTTGRTGDRPQDAKGDQRRHRPHALALLGEFGYEAPATSSSGLILPNFSRSTSPPPTNDLKPNERRPADRQVRSTHRRMATPPAAARSSRDARPRQLLHKGGQIISFNIEDPVPYSDYWEDAPLSRSNCRPKASTARPRATTRTRGTGTTLRKLPVDDPLGQRRELPLCSTRTGSTARSRRQRQLRRVQDTAATALTTLEGTNPTDTAAITTARAGARADHDDRRA